MQNMVRSDVMYTKESNLSPSSILIEVYLTCDVNKGS
jgi:hypothetical protein